MKPIINNIIRLREIPSTNEYLLKNHKNYSEGTLIITDHQTAGKGLEKNHWESEKGKNLTLSLLLRPQDVQADEQFNLNIATSLAIRRFLQEHTKTEVMVKWPNDLYIDTKKIAGILIRNFLYGSSIDLTVVGIGINVNQEQFHSDAPNPVSLKQITGGAHSLDKLLKSLTNHLEKYFHSLYKRNFSTLINEYYQYLFRLNEWGDYIIDKNHVKAYIQGIDDFGRLRLTDEQGRSYACGFKEIRFL